MSLASVSALSPEDQNAMMEYTDMVNLQLLFQTMMQCLTTEQPDDPHDFLIKWLEKNPIHMKKRVPADFRETIKGMFRRADLDKSGFLDRRELKSVFIQLREDLGLSDSDIRLLMAEADENDDGVIDYEEFCHIAVDVLHSIYAKMDFEAEQAYRVMNAKEEVSQQLLRGMTEQELKGILEGVFKKADTDGNGTLDVKEFQACLRDTDLGFTKKEINIMLSEVDANGDGIITYDEFAPLAFDILVELMSKEFLSAPTDELQLTDFFLDLFSGFADSANKVSHTAAETAMLGADLGLTRMQVLACLSECTDTSMQKAEDGEVLGTVSDIMALSESVAGMVFQIYQEWGY
jgi:Ca2+-binding EF-hand superfamily protein